MEIKKCQIKKLLKQFAAIYKIQQKMSMVCDGKKSFALDGRIIGDMGECLAGYLYDIQIADRQTPGQDGTYNKKPVEIKVRTKNRKGIIDHIHISDSTINKNGCYLIVLAFDTNKRTINVEINNWMSAKTLKSLKRTVKGFVTLSNLKSKIKVNDNKQQRKIKVSGWTITYNEEL